MFNKKFKVVEIRDNGITTTYYLKGKKKDIKADIETFKNNSQQYEMIGNKGMIVWV